MTQDNPVRGRLNAWLLSAMDGYMHWKYAAMKQTLLADTPATLVELGPGAGANFRYVPEGKQLIAIEPNVHMHAALQNKAKHRHITLDLRGLAGEQLDLATDSVEFVFCSLVLCTVDHPKQVIAEVRRVLKPGGRFVCIEHVAAESSSVLHRLQHRFKRPWRWFFEGCDLCRDTAQLLQSSGFASVEIEAFTLPTVLFPIRPQIKAVCIN